MKLLKTTSVRFSQLVKSAGQPAALTLWSDPESDPAFAKAVESNRVLTVRQFNVGSQKDFGVIGYHAEKNASFLIFPKPLAYASGTRVIGIKYDLLTQPKPKDPVAPKDLRPPSPRVRNSPEPLGITIRDDAPARRKAVPAVETVVPTKPVISPSKEVSHRPRAVASPVHAPLKAQPIPTFVATVRCTVTQEMEITVQAVSLAAAEEAALELAREEPPDFKNQKLDLTVLSLKRR